MPRTPTDVINQAISENRRSEVLLYGFAILSFVTGVGLIFFLGELGSLVSALCVPAIALAERTRKQNMMIRMMELPLSQANTADDAAKTLTKTFADVFAKSKGKR